MVPQRAGWSASHKGRDNKGFTIPTSAYPLPCVGQGGHVLGINSANRIGGGWTLTIIVGAPFFCIGLACGSLIGIAVEWRRKQTPGPKDLLNPHFLDPSGKLRVAGSGKWPFEDPPTPNRPDDPSQGTDCPTTWILPTGPPLVGRLSTIGLVGRVSSTCLGENGGNWAGSLNLNSRPL